MQLIVPQTRIYHGTLREVTVLDCCAAANDATMGHNKAKVVKWTTRDPTTMVVIAAANDARWRRARMSISPQPNTSAAKGAVAAQVSGTPTRAATPARLIDVNPSIDVDRIAAK